MECHVHIYLYIYTEFVKPCSCCKIQTPLKLPFAKAFALADGKENFGKHGSEVSKLKYNAGKALEELAQKHGDGDGS